MRVYHMPCTCSHTFTHTCTYVNTFHVGRHQCTPTSALALPLPTTSSLSTSLFRHPSFSLSVTLPERPVLTVSRFMATVSLIWLLFVSMPFAMRSCINKWNLFPFPLDLAWLCKLTRTSNMPPEFQSVSYRPQDTLRVSLILLEPCPHHINEPRLAFWMMRTTGPSHRIIPAGSQTCELKAFYSS